MSVTLTRQSISETALGAPHFADARQVQQDECHKDHALGFCADSEGAVGGNSVDRQVTAESGATLSIWSRPLCLERIRSQLGVGGSMWSMMTTGVGTFFETNLKPACSAAAM